MAYRHHFVLSIDVEMHTCAIFNDKKLIFVSKHVVQSGIKPDISIFYADPYANLCTDIWRIVVFLHEDQNWIARFVPVSNASAE